MTVAEIIDFTKTALLAQGKRAFDTNTHTCLYRGPENTRCAIGLLIPDDMYLPNMEQRQVEILLQEYSQLKPVLLPSDLDEESGTRFLQQLQRIHDDWPNAANWPAQFETLSRRWSR